MPAREKSSDGLVADGPVKDPISVSGRQRVLSPEGKRCIAVHLWTLICFTTLFSAHHLVEEIHWNLIGVYRADVHCVLSKESWKWTELLQLLLVIPPRQLELQWKRSWLGPGRLKVPPGWTQLPQTRWEIGYVVTTFLKNIRQHILGCAFQYMYTQYQTVQNTNTAKMDA